MYTRKLQLPELLKKRSYFLFGPRATGKSTLIKHQLIDVKVYDLLDAVTYQRLLIQPSIIEEETSSDTIVVIDEIQKLPLLLDEVHRQIANRNQRFLLTGSSARKLRRGGVNLLAGRAFQAELMPLTSREIDDFDLLTYINTTGLPEFYGDEDASEFLKAYIGTYLLEEVHAESLTKNLPAFSRFLETVAINNGEEINYASYSSDTGVPTRTLENYFSILTDTLLGFWVSPFRQTIKRKATARSKYWLFDIGVTHQLAKTGNVQQGSTSFGKAFEHFIALELYAWIAYSRSDLKLQYWRTNSGLEVDFILGNQLAIEVKSTNQVKDKHFKSLRALREEGVIENYMVVSNDPDYRQTSDDIDVYPWQLFLDKLWSNSF